MYKVNFLDRKLHQISIDFSSREEAWDCFTGQIMSRCHYCEIIDTLNKNHKIGFVGKRVITNNNIIYQEFKIDENFLEELEIEISDSIEEEA